MWSGTDFHLLHEDRKGLWTRDTGEIFKERGGCMGSLKADPGYFSKKDRVGRGGAAYCPVWTLGPLKPLFRVCARSQRLVVIVH